MSKGQAVICLLEMALLPLFFFFASHHLYLIITHSPLTQRNWMNPEELRHHVRHTEEANQSDTEPQSKRWPQTPRVKQAHKEYPSLRKSLQFRLYEVKLLVRVETCVFNRHSETLPGGFTLSVLSCRQVTLTMSLRWGQIWLRTKN